MSGLFTFPNPVNEVAARVVAGVVALLALACIVFAQPWLLVVLAYGFVARVLTGPTLSPLGRLATRVVAPRLPLPDRPVAGPPKRFAQGIGAVLSICAVVLAYGVDAPGAAYALAAAIAVAATLESAFGFCIGCRLFAGLMRLGVVPESVCLECADISLRAG